MTIRLAIVGVGNCAAALVQGLEYYKDVKPDEEIPGLMHPGIGGYKISDIRIAAAFDVDAEKVSKDVSEAIWASANNTIRFAEVPNSGVEVQRGPTYDGLGEYYQGRIKESEIEAVDVTAALRAAAVDVMVLYLPVGSQLAVEHYVNCALDAGVAVVNALPVFIASDPAWQQRFLQSGLPVIGDDVKSQFGATISHRTLARLFETRGVKIDHTYQLNVGGNMDFMNMLERSRLNSKKISKTRAVTSNIFTTLQDRDVHVGPSDFVPWLDDRKVAFVRLEGSGFGNVPINIEYRLEVWDSPNSAGVVIDAVRIAKLALDRGIAGPIESASAYLMKSPPVQFPDDVARELLERFIAGTD